MEGNSFRLQGMLVSSFGDHEKNTFQENWEENDENHSFNCKLRTLYFRINLVYTCSTLFLFRDHKIQNN